MSDEIKALVERASRLLPVVVNITQDYAELSFGDAHPTQAMTMQPDDWLALNDIASALTAQADEIERLRGELRRIAEGNLGDASWQANYEKIRDVARAAQEVKP